jgi:hypothetical protein
MIRTLVATLVGLGLIAASRALLADDSTTSQTDPPKVTEVRQDPLGKFDKNLVKSEVAKAKKKKGAKGGDGQLAAEAILKKYDTNGDGKLDATELAAMMKDLHAKRETNKKKTAT